MESFLIVFVYYEYDVVNILALFKDVNGVVYEWFFKAVQ